MFHVKDGLYIDRLEGGQVRITKRDDLTKVFDVTLSVEEWASVAAFASGFGYNSAVWNAIVALQKG
jgi:hypothetical protein